MNFEEESGVNLYIDWTDEEEMKILKVPYMFGRIDVPGVGMTKKNYGKGLSLIIAIFSEYQASDKNIV